MNNKTRSVIILMPQISSVCMHYGV